MIVSKITTGYVHQLFDTETGLCISQKFISGDSVEYEETETGEHVSEEVQEKLDEEYFPFDMIQPE